MRRAGIVMSFALLALCSGCSNLAQIAPAADQPVSLTIEKRAAVALPAEVDLASTSFGQYFFEATSGERAMHGLLPLRFRGDYLALDILFFPLAMLFNLRTTYDYYEFDVAAGEVRYRQDPSSAWVSYRPSEAEVAKARSHFESRRQAAESTGGG